MGGAAIVAALAVVAIAAIAAAGLLYAQALWQSEIELSAEAAQSRMAARAGIAWAAAVLRQDVLTSSTDHLAEPWTTPLPPTHVEGSRIEGAISDLQGLYNLNNLVRSGTAQSREIARYKRLLRALKLPELLADTLADWIDTDDRVTGDNGAEDSYYLALPGPYRTSGQPLAELNELLRVKGYTHAVVAALRPYVAVIPGSAAINVNTAPPEVLMLTAERLTLEDAHVLSAGRARLPYRDVAEFRMRLPPSAQPVDADIVRVTSEYFLVDAHVRRGSARVHAQAVVKRPAAAWPSVVWQRFGG